MIFGLPWPSTIGVSSRPRPGTPRTCLVAAAPTECRHGYPATVAVAMIMDGRARSGRAQTHRGALLGRLGAAQQADQPGDPQLAVDRRTGVAEHTVDAA